MAKHAKTTVASSLRKAGARTTAVAALATAGMFGATGMAAADHGSSDGDFHNTNGVVNVNDNNTQVNGQACNNNVPVNVLGVQVPVENATGALGIGSDDTEASSASSKNCDQKVVQNN